MLDLSLDENLETRFWSVLANNDPDAIATLLPQDTVLLGLADSGAHVSQLCDACFSTDLLGNWVRDKDVMPLEHAIHKLTGEPAGVFGLDGPGHARGRQGRRRRRLRRRHGRSGPAAAHPRLPRRRRTPRRRPARRRTPRARERHADPGGRRRRRRRARRPPGHAPAQLKERATRPGTLLRRGRKSGEKALQFDPSRADTSRAGRAAPPNGRRDGVSGSETQGGGQTTERVQPRGGNRRFRALRGVRHRRPAMETASGSRVHGPGRRHRDPARGRDRRRRARDACRTPAGHARTVPPLDGQR